MPPMPSPPAQLKGDRRPNPHDLMPKRSDTDITALTDDPSSRRQPPSACTLAESLQRLWTVGGVAVTTSPSRSLKSAHNCA